MAGPARESVCDAYKVERCHSVGAGPAPKAAAPGQYGTRTAAVHATA